jgi:hypothetical protein
MNRRARRDAAPHGAISQPPFVDYLDGPLVEVAPPVGLPVSLAAARTQCRIDDDVTADDAFLREEIDRARDLVETEAGGVQLLAATYDLPVKTWWGGWSGGVPGIYGLIGLSYGLQCSDGTLRLPRAPLLEVVSIRYYDAADTPQTLDSGNYVVRTPWKMPGEIDRAPVAVWPPLSPFRQYPITVRFTAGFAVAVTAVSTSGKTLTVGGPKTYANGDTVRLSNSGGALPAPLVAGQLYYVVGATGGGLTFQLALTAGGSPITLNDAGTGTHYVGRIPPKVAKAVLMLVGAAYREREPGERDKYTQAALASLAGGLFTGGYK